MRTSCLVRSKHDTYLRHISLFVRIRVNHVARIFLIKSEGVYGDMLCASVEGEQLGERGRGGGLSGRNSLGLRIDRYGYTG